MDGAIKNGQISKMAAVGPKTVAESAFSVGASTHGAEGDGAIMILLNLPQNTPDGQIQ